MKKKESKTLWNNSGGDWYDRNGVLQGNTPYATITISGDRIPDNRYYELDVTKLIQEYANWKSEKYWFLNKGPRGRQKLYCFLQFYMKNTSPRPKLTVEYT